MWKLCDVKKARMRSNSRVMLTPTCEKSNMMKTLPIMISLMLENSHVTIAFIWEHFHVAIRYMLCVFGGWIRLIVGFQPLMVISPTASWIRWCMQVYACELLWTCLVRCQATDSISPQVSRNESLRPYNILTPSRPPSRFPNSLMPSAKLRSANLPVFASLVWRGRGSNPGLPHPERTL